MFLWYLNRHLHMKMKRIFMSIMAVFFPWIVLLAYDNPGGAFVALILQATLIGWIPASIWAWRTIYGTTKDTTPETPNQ